MNANHDKPPEPVAQNSRPFASIRGSTSQTIRLSMREIVGRGYAVEDAAGQRVFERIAEAFRNGQRVQLSFANVELTIAAFLNVAVGQLFGEFTEDEIRTRLSVTDISQQDLALLKLVVDNAKAYFRRQRAGAPALQNTLQAVAANTVSSTPTN